MWRRIVIFIVLSFKCQSFAIQKNKIKEIDEAINVTLAKIRNQKNERLTPELLMFLAELYFDKAVFLKANQNKTEDIQIEILLKEALEVYKIIEQRFPNHSQTAKAIFMQGILSKALGDEKSFQEKMKAVINNFPKSEFAARAQLELGNGYVDKGDCEFALEFFNNLESFKANYPRYFYQAKLKSGVCFAQLEQYLKSIDAYDEILRLSGNKLLELLDIVEEAATLVVFPLFEVDLAQVAARPELQDPTRYLAGKDIPLSAKRKGLERVIKRSEIKKRPDDTLKALWELFRITPHVSEQRSIFDQAYLMSKKMNIRDWPSFVLPKLLQMIFKMESAFEISDNSKDIFKYEPVIRDLLTQTHENVMKTKRKDEMILLANYYQDYLSFYGSSQKADLMMLNLAELFYNLGRYESAGFHYFEALKLSKKFGNIKERLSVYKSALQSFKICLTANDDDLNNIIKCQGGYKQVANFYLREYPNAKDRAEVEFNVVKIIYDEQNYIRAREEIWKWLKKHPRHQLAETAAFLYLDTYYLGNELKKLAMAAEKLQKEIDLSPEVRQKIKNLGQAVTLKSIRQVAGDFGSKKHATAFLEFARKNKNSELGEQALYEAFLSLKAQANPQAFDVGEEFLSNFPKSAKAKEVTLALIEFGFQEKQFLKAAQYLVFFANHFENDLKASEFLEQACLIFEAYGKWQNAHYCYKKSKKLNQAFTMLVNGLDWKMLNEEAAKETIPSATFFQALALWFLGKKSDSTRLFQKVAESLSPAEGLFYGLSWAVVADERLKTLKDLSQRKTVLSQESLKNAQLAYVGINQAAIEILKSDDIDSRVLGLVFQKLANVYFLEFLDSLQPPNGINMEQFKALINQQAKSYRDVIKDIDQQLEKLNQLGIPSPAYGVLNSGFDMKRFFSFAIISSPDVLPKNSWPKDANIDSIDQLKKIVLYLVQMGRTSEAMIVTYLALGEGKVAKEPALDLLAYVFYQRGQLMKARDLCAQYEKQGLDFSKQICQQLRQKWGLKLILNE